MPLVEILIGTLGAPLAKLLLKNYLEDPAEAVGLSLIDLAKKKIEGRLGACRVTVQGEGTSRGSGEYLVGALGRALVSRKHCSKVRQQTP